METCIPAPFSASASRMALGTHSDSHIYPRMGQRPSKPHLICGTVCRATLVVLGFAVRNKAWPPRHASPSVAYVLSSPFLSRAFPSGKTLPGETERTARAIL